MCLTLSATPKIVFFFKQRQARILSLLRDAITEGDDMRKSKAHTSLFIFANRSVHLLVDSTSNLSLKPRLYTAEQTGLIQALPGAKTPKTGVFFARRLNLKGFYI